MRKNIGILLPVSSLPSSYGIGDFGNTSFQWINWLSKNHYRYWQILPLNPLGFGNSPYTSICSNAIDVRYISLDLLREDGLLGKIPEYRKESPYVNFEKVLTFKEKYLHKAFKNYQKTKMEGMKKFKTRYPWVMKFATFVVFKEHNQDKEWFNWPDYELHYFENHNNPPKQYHDEIDYHIFTQYVAYIQWKHVLSYAHEMNIKIIADMPFYVGSDSVECWLHKDEFAFDPITNKQQLAGGVPPDYFSKTGQMWGSPIYLFDKMKENGYQLLVDRLGYLGSICDYLRLDHFRAFDTYYVIPADEETAVNGEWKVGPRKEFFDKLKEAYPEINLIAEDLGELFPSVIELRDELNLPGMFVVQFTMFDDTKTDKDAEGMIVYSGTHDNETLYGWLKNLTEEQITTLRKRFHCRKRDLYQRLVKYTLSLNSEMTIFALQDVLMLDNKARMNVPGTVGYPNFAWRFKSFDLLKKIKFKIK